MSVIDLTFDFEDGSSAGGLLDALDGRAAQNTEVPSASSVVSESADSTFVIADSPDATTLASSEFNMSSVMPGRGRKRKRSTVIMSNGPVATAIADTPPSRMQKGKLSLSEGVLIELLDSQEGDDVEPIGYVTYKRPQPHPTAQVPFRDHNDIEHIGDDYGEDTEVVSLSEPQASRLTTLPPYSKSYRTSINNGTTAAPAPTLAPRLTSLYSNTSGYVAGSATAQNLLLPHADIRSGYRPAPFINLYQPPLPPLHDTKNAEAASSRYQTSSPLQPTVESSAASSHPADPQSRMCMLGQLRATLQISSGSIYFNDNVATQIPATLRNRIGGATEVDIYDNKGRVVGILEQSVAQPIYALLEEEVVKVAGMIQGPLKGRFISSILLSLYANRQMAVLINRILQECGLYLDQSSAEAQLALHDLGQEANILTRGMNYVAKDPTRDNDGLMALDANSDVSIPSVFKEMNFKVPREGGGRGGGSDYWERVKTKRNKQALPQTMVVEKVNEPLEDGKTRLANIKSTFVTQLDLPEMEPPAQVRTLLRRHQKQALYFMVHRETQDVDIQSLNDSQESLFPKLWVPTNIGPGTSGSARSEFKHVLTNIKCIQKPESVLGGILADDMGLGKTLSVISLILKVPAPWKQGSRLKFVNASTSADEVVVCDSDSDRKTKRPSSSSQGPRAKRVRKHRRSVGRIIPDRGKAPSFRVKGGDEHQHQHGDVDVVIDSSDDSDSFTDLPRRKKPKLAKDSLLSDAESLASDPLALPPAQTEDVSSMSSFSSASSQSSGGDSSDNDCSDDSQQYFSDHRPMTPPPEFDNMATRRKEECDRRFAKNYHGRYAGGTLIVCPVSTIGNWTDQVLGHVRSGCLRVYAYHGSARVRNPKKLCQYDIVLTTYNVVQSEFNKERKQMIVEGDESTMVRPMFDSSSEEENNTKLYQIPDGPYVSPLQAVHWHRVVLDEAQAIKERRTICSQASSALTSSRRWCLTGTPIQNRLDDLYSLLRFLHAAPLSNWKVWLTYIAAPFHENIREYIDTDDVGNMVKTNVGAHRVQRLMQTLCLRRMKNQVDTKTNRRMVELPPKFEVIRWLELSEGERRLYAMAEDMARNKYRQMSQNGTLLKNYMHILKIILRLRQLCTHPKLWSKDKWKEAKVLGADAAISAQVNAAGKGISPDCDDVNGNDTGTNETYSKSKAETKPKSNTEAKPKVDSKVGSKVEPKTESKKGVKAEAKAESKPNVKSEVKAENKASIKAETKTKAKSESAPTAQPEPDSEAKPSFESNNMSAVDLCSMVMADSSSASQQQQTSLYEHWAKQASIWGELVKCDYCNSRALPAGLVEHMDAFQPNDHPGPSVTRCGHICCHQCRMVLFEVGESSTMTECVLCGDMLDQQDVAALPARILFSSIPKERPAQPEVVQLEEDADGSDYSELNRLCQEHDSSTKAATLIQDIKKIRSRQWISDAHFAVDQNDASVQSRKAELEQFPEMREKCVVFSQWTGMLDIIEPLLQDNGIRFTRLDGKMTRNAREENLRVFKNDPEVEVFLVSLRAGGFGLNLTHATHAFLMDAFWNPSVENQAIDRIYRLGQRCPITVTRYFVKDSIEEKIMKLQRRKARIVDISLMDSTRNRGPGSIDSDEDETLAITTGTHSRQQRLDDLNLLFG